MRRLLHEIQEEFQKGQSPTRKPPEQEQSEGGASSTAQTSVGSTRFPDSKGGHTFSIIPCNDYNTGFAPHSLLQLPTLPHGHDRQVHHPHTSEHPVLS